MLNFAPGAGPKFGEWFGKYTTADYVSGPLTTDTNAAVEALKLRGATSVAVIGFCWVRKRVGLWFNRGHVSV